MHLSRNKRCPSAISEFLLFLYFSYLREFSSFIYKNQAFLKIYFSCMVFFFFLLLFLLMASSQKRGTIELQAVTLFLLFWKCSSVMSLTTLSACSLCFKDTGHLQLLASLSATFSVSSAVL